jgi:RimJ/RimL family protein N-acetyltransferase
MAELPRLASEPLELRHARAAVHLTTRSITMPTEPPPLEPITPPALPRVLQSERLTLRPWQQSDREPFARLNADPRVMEYFPALHTREQSDASIDRFSAHLEQHGFGMWALEAHGVAPFIGMLGLNIPRFEAHFTPCVEIGWRLAAEHWGHGYAIEAARLALRFAFEDLGLPEIVSFTTPQNQRSRRVMETLGMKHDPSGDFDHPTVPEGHPLRRHVLYRMRADQYVG